MLASEVTTSAFSDADASCSRTAAWRRSSAALGACDMNGCEPLLERCDNSPHPKVLARPGQGFGEFLDPTFQFGITGSQPKRRLVLCKRVRDIVATTVDVAHRAKG